MATKTVVIECDEENGQETYSVGLKPQEGDEGPEDEGGGAGGGPEAQEGVEGSPEEEKDEQSYMSPAKNLEDALSIAKDLLTSGQAAQAVNNNAAFEGGFAQASGK